MEITTHGDPLKNGFGVRALGSVLSSFFLLLFFRTSALISPGGSGKEKKGEKTTARTQLSTRSGTRPHQSTPSRTAKTEQSDKYEQGQKATAEQLV